MRSILSPVSGSAPPTRFSIWAMRWALVSLKDSNERMNSSKAATTSSEVGGASADFRSSAGIGCMMVIGISLLC